MRSKPVGLLILAAVAAVAAVAGRAGAAGQSYYLTADLELRPGVSQHGHPEVDPKGLYGALNAYYNHSTRKFTWTLEYKDLDGPVFRVVLRSRATGKAYLVLCSPCRPVVFPHSSHEHRAVSQLGGSVRLDLDTAYLINGDRTFIEADTTAYPGGEIGAPVILYVPPVVKKGHPVTKDFPRCC